MNIIWLPLIVTFGGFLVVMIVSGTEKVSAYGLPIRAMFTGIAWIAALVTSWVMWALS